MTIAFVSQLYRSFLGREPDPAGLGFWVDLLASGQVSAAQATLTFARSEEHLAVFHPVARLYIAALGRTPDAEGLQHWAGALKGGASPSALAAGFAQAPEFISRFGELGRREFAAVLYRDTLGREPDAAGLDFWAAQMDLGLSSAALVTAFAQSPVHVALRQDAAQFALLHAAILGEVPSLAQTVAALPVADWLELITSLYMRAAYRGADVPGIARFVEPDPGVTYYDDGGPPAMPTLGLDFNMTLAGSVAAVSDLAGSLMFDDGMVISPLAANTPLDLGLLPMLGAITSGGLMVRTPSGGQSDVSTQVVTFGTTGDDPIDAAGSAEVQYIFSGAGQDAITGGDAADVIYAGMGDDLIDGCDGDDALFSGGGNDTLTGGAGADTFVISGVGSSVITDLGVGIGVGGVDALQVGADALVNALVLADWAADAATSNLGTASLSLANGIAADLSLATGAVGYSISAAGNTDASLIVGSGFNDTITGGNGADTITGGLGADAIDGAGGADTFTYGAVILESSVSTTLATAAGFDTVSVTVGDTFVFNAVVQSAQGVKLAGIPLAASGTGVLAQLSAAFTMGASIPGDVEAGLIRFTSGEQFLVVDVNRDNAITAADQVISVIGNFDFLDNIAGHIVINAGAG